jgi:hypothetical protein
MAKNGRNSRRPTQMDLLNLSTADVLLRGRRTLPGKDCDCEVEVEDGRGGPCRRGAFRRASVVGGSVIMMKCRQRELLFESVARKEVSSILLEPRGNEQVV